MSTVRCSICGKLGHNKLSHSRGENKKCCICKRELPIGAFHYNRKILTDSIATDYLSSTCKECSNLRSYERYRSNFKNRFGYLLAAIKSRCKKKGIECSITTTELETILANQEGKCSLSGLPLSLETGDNAISIDRIDPSKGYTIENITLVTWLLNNMKRHLTTTQFINMCKTVADKSR